MIVCFSWSDVVACGSCVVLPCCILYMVVLCVLRVQFHPLQCLLYIMMGRYCVCMYVPP